MTAGTRYYLLLRRNRRSMVRYDILLWGRFRCFSFLTGYTYECAAEQKARSTYEYLIDMAEDPDVLAPLRFLREREIVHFQRFGEALEIARDHMNHKHYFYANQK